MSVISRVSAAGSRAVGTRMAGSRAEAGSPAADTAPSRSTEDRSFRLTPPREDRRPAVTAEEVTLAPGDRVVLSGDMSCSREELQARLLSQGYVPWPGVTKNVALVVVADLATTSEKVQKARHHGIPVVDEARLTELLR